MILSPKIFLSGLSVIEASYGSTQILQLFPPCPGPQDS
ncbi:hypothetical protein APTSU1_001047300 [Apodemus speciosus]|uniref:Uncharacterized protein n=1 Tax=Apodemus speciosus TaxID=105296 RepID=A0ABQ0F7L7_APOSI